MHRIQLVHWNAQEAAERAERLAALGYEVAHQIPPVPAFLRALRQDPPHAIVIDLGRLPSQGRDFALTLRKNAGTRGVPLLFVDGRPDKVDRVRQLLPDAIYATWNSLGPALAEAIAHPPEAPIVPDSSFAAYAGRPLASKLGVKAGMTVALLGAPPNFEATLGSLPDAVVLQRDDPNDSDLTLWFVTARAELEGDVVGMVPHAARAPLWIAWPKRASGVRSDLTQQVVRQTGLDAGLVDYKICSIDKTWSGLLFTKRQGK
jgi:hypothetical protein